jgi:hypothetical protein
MAAHPRWPSADGTLAVHTRCGGCLKCQSKTNLRLDAIGGVFCEAHMRQRVLAAGGPSKANDRDALRTSEAGFVPARLCVSACK